MSPGSPGTTLVGRPDARSTRRGTGAGWRSPTPACPWPATRRVTILLAPSDLVKRGTHFDLAIALAVLAACGDLSPAALSDTLVIGELTLTGGLRSVPGVLPMVMAASRRGFARVIVPEPQAREAAMVPGMAVFGMRSLAQVRAELRGEPVPEAAAGRADVRQPPDRVAWVAAAGRARPGRPRRRPRREVRARGRGRRRAPPDAVRARRGRGRRRWPSASRASCPTSRPRRRSSSPPSTRWPVRSSRVTT